MGIYIKDMEMPKDCGECHFCHAEGFKSWCCPTEREDILFDAIPEWCPLTEVPEPHGRLIDADACIDYIRNNNQQAWEALAYAPTIDAVEVVRCKDCKHKYVSGNGTTQYYVCDFMDAQYEEDGFCHHGESEVKE